MSGAFGAAPAGGSWDVRWHPGLWSTSPVTAYRTSSGSNQDIVGFGEAGVYVAVA